MPSRVRTVANYNMKIIFGATGGIEPPWVRSAIIHLLTNLHSAFIALLGKAIPTVFFLQASSSRRNLCGHTMSRTSFSLRLAKTRALQCSKRRKLHTVCLLPIYTPYLSAESAPYISNEFCCKRMFSTNFIRNALDFDVGG